MSWYPIEKPVVLLAWNRLFHISWLIYSFSKKKISTNWVDKNTEIYQSDLAMDLNRANEIVRTLTRVKQILFLEPISMFFFSPRGYVEK